MPCGRSVALKLAPARGDEADMLRNEAHAYLALQDLWGKDVPELLLAGPLVTFGSGYALGTALLPGRPLQQGADPYTIAGLCDIWDVCGHFHHLTCICQEELLGGSCVPFSTLAEVRELRLDGF